MTTPERFDAYDALMKADDPIDLPPRGRRYRFAGNHLRMQQLKADLPRCAIAYRIEAWRDSSEIVTKNERAFSRGRYARDYSCHAKTA